MSVVLFGQTRHRSDETAEKIVSASIPEQLMQDISCNLRKEIVNNGRCMSAALAHSVFDALLNWCNTNAKELINSTLPCKTCSSSDAREHYVL
jgi:hypothetical protein